MSGRGGSSFGSGSVPLAFFSAAANSGCMTTFELSNARVDFGDCCIIASAQSFDVYWLMECLWASLADTKHDCFDSGPRRRA